MDRTRMTGTPPRRAARPIRVRARFTPTRSTVFRAAPGFDAPVDPAGPVDPHDLLPATDPSVDGPATAPTAGADAGPTAATVEPAEEPVVEEPTVEEPVVEEPAVEEALVEEPAEEPVVEEPAEELVEEAVVEEPVEDEVHDAPVDADDAPVDVEAHDAPVGVGTVEDEPAAAVVPEPVEAAAVVAEPAQAAQPVGTAAVPHPAAPAASTRPAPPAPPVRSPGAVPPPVPTPPDPATDPYRDSESLAQALGLKPPPPGAPEVVVARKGPRARRDAAGPRRRWLPVALVAAAVAVLVVVMSIRAAVTGDAEPSRAATSGSPGASATPTSAAAAAAVASWLQANRVGARTVAPDPEATALRGAGVEVTSGALASTGTGDTVVLTRPAAQVTDPVPVSAASSWVPLAAFGDGDSRAVVGVVLGRAATDVAADRDSAAATAAAACTALGTNVAVDIGPDARPVFDAGLVDLRATAFLAALSQETPVQVVAVRVDDAERTAGTAARVVEVGGAAGDAVRSLAEQAHGTFAPTVTDGDGGRIVLTWSVEADPASLTAR